MLAEKANSSHVACGELTTFFFPDIELRLR